MSIGWSVYVTNQVHDDDDGIVLIYKSLGSQIRPTFTGHKITKNNENAWIGWAICSSG